MSPETKERSGKLHQSELGCKEVSATLLTNDFFARFHDETLEIFRVLEHHDVT